MGKQFCVSLKDLQATDQYKVKTAIRELDVLFPKDGNAKDEEHGKETGAKNLNHVYNQYEKRSSNSQQPTFMGLNGIQDMGNLSEAGGG